MLQGQSEPVCRVVLYMWAQGRMSGPHELAAPLAERVHIPTVKGGSAGGGVVCIGSSVSKVDKVTVGTGVGAVVVVRQRKPNGDPRKYAGNGVSPDWGAASKRKFHMMDLRILMMYGRPTFALLSLP
jgi:hypothetical protein